MKYKFILENIETGVTQKCKTMQEIVEIIGVPYHQARSIYLAHKKQFLHPNIKEYCRLYKIYDNPEINVYY
jgi:hypothetical protein